MSIDAALAAGRAAHEVLMIDTCSTGRPSGAQTFNSTTGEYSQATDPVYSGACRVKPWTSNDSDAAEAEVNVTRVYVDLPWAAAVHLRDDVVTVTSASDWLDGRALKVTSVHLSTTSTCQRLVAEAVQ